VPGGVLCQDFNETLANPRGGTGCGQATRTDACTNNPTGIPNDDPTVP